MVDSLPRRQSRPFQSAPTEPDEGVKVTPPSLDLMEHLESVFSTTDHAAMLATIKDSNRSLTEAALVMLAETAGREQVLGYMRLLIDQAREVGRPG